MKDDLLRSARLYRAFRESEPKKARWVKVRRPKAVMVMGHAEFIGYATTHGRRGALYIHEWAEGSRPLLCATGRTGELFLLLGRFKVTGRGITDLDARGRVTDPAPRYRVTKRGRR